MKNAFLTCMTILSVMVIAAFAEGSTPKNACSGKDIKSFDYIYSEHPNNKGKCYYFGSQVDTTMIEPNKQLNVSSFGVVLVDFETKKVVEEFEGIVQVIGTTIYENEDGKKQSIPVISPITILKEFKPTKKATKVTVATCKGKPRTDFLDLLNDNLNNMKGKCYGWFGATNRKKISPNKQLHFFTNRTVLVDFGTSKVVDSFLGDVLVTGTHEYVNESGKKEIIPVVMPADKIIHDR